MPLTKPLSVLCCCFLLSCGGGPTTTEDASVDATRPACLADLDCDDGLFCNGEESCLSGACVAGAPVLCADDLECTADGCDEDRRACVHEAPDEDGDGHATVACGGDDCDDADADRYPGNAEVCDAEDHDEDCDPTTFGVRDADGDGWPDAACCNVAADGGRVCGDDCDDALPTAHPSEAESCDGVDNDCDGEIDEGVERTFYIDADGDHHGDPAGTTTTGCYAPDGYAEGDDDCDDAHASAHPGGTEVCDADGVDEDCDGEANPTSLCNCTAPSSSPCDLPGVCAAGTRSCVGGSWGACSIMGGAESCNGADDDCDGVIDEGLRVTCFADGDGDGVAAPGAADSALCPVTGREAFGGCPVDSTNRAPLGAINLDCDDADPSRSPDQAEVCDGVDNDCDGAIDEGLTVTCYTDGDRDGSPVGAAQEVCPAAGGACPAGMTSTSPAGAGTDCDDGNPARFPGAVEVCDADGVDEDCDGAVNEGLEVLCYVDGDGDGYARGGVTATRVCPTDLASACPAGTTITAPADSVTTDCDDSRADVSPGAPEVCDLGSPAVDEDCDGLRNEGVTAWLYVDEDGDGYGRMPRSGSDTGSRVETCPGAPGFSDNAGDCDDTRADVHPGAPGKDRPICRAGETTCRVQFSVGSYSIDASIGCLSALGCREGNWDYDCDGRFTPEVELCRGPTACGGGGCTGGASWDLRLPGPPCGLDASQGVSWGSCGCASGRGCELSPASHRGRFVCR